MTTIEQFIELRLACERGDLALVENLIEHHHVDPSMNYNMAIQVASMNGQLPIVQRLLQDHRVNPADLDNSALIGALFIGRSSYISHH